MRQIETRHWRRITKAKARKLYNAGEDVLVVPCKVHPENEYGIGTLANNNFWKHLGFEKFLDSFCLYNCQYNEWGKYPAFYERRENNG